MDEASIYACSEKQEGLTSENAEDQGTGTSHLSLVKTVDKEHGHNRDLR